MRKLTDEQKIEVVQKYLTGNFTCAELGREYGVDGNSISGLLKRRGVSVFNVPEVIQRKYTLNTQYFDIIDSEDKAYFLGLLYADGCNYTPIFHVFIGLQSEDSEILIKLNKFIGSNRPLEIKNRRQSNWKDMSILHINSKRISQRLVELGCVQAKALILKFPTEEQVPSHLIRHFIRGYFDGDGCVGSYWPNRGKKMMKTVTASTEEVCLGIQKILSDTLNIYAGICKINKKSLKSTRQLTTHTTVNSYKFLTWLYYGSDLYFERKYQKYLEGGNMIDNDTRAKIDEDVKLIIEQQGVSMSPDELAESDE